MSDVPVDPTKRKALKGCISEITICLQRIDEQKEQMKDICEAAQDEFGIQKKYISKLARTVYKQNYDSMQAENSHFEDLYESIAEGRNDQEDE